MTETVAIGPVRDLSEVRPLWLELAHHIQAVSPEELPDAVPDETSWERRRAEYAGWLSDPDAFGLIARTDGGAVAGYAIVSIERDHGLDDTWATAPVLAELQSLAVSAPLRSRGVGGALLDAVEAELRARGIRELLIGAVTTNHDALRFYARRGYTPFAVTLYRRL